MKNIFLAWADFDVMNFCKRIYYRFWQRRSNDLQCTVMMIIIPTFYGHERNDPKLMRKKKSQKCMHEIIILAFNVVVMRGRIFILAKLKA